MYNLPEAVAQLVCLSSVIDHLVLQHFVSFERR